MATETVPQEENASGDAPHTEPVTSAQVLEPREYLQWLLSIESAGLPNGTRAYLVSIDNSGRRALTRVPESASVVDIRTNLFSHLDATPYGPDFFLSLRDFCDERLQKWAKGSVSVHGRRLALCNDAAREICALHDVLQDQIEAADDSELRLRTNAIMARLADLNHALFLGLSGEESVDEVEKLIELDGGAS